MTSVLIIDDDAFFQAVLQKVLEDRGYVVYCASTGIEGLRIFEQVYPNVVVTDILMPDKDGIEVILDLKRKYQNVKIIAMSGGGRIKANDHLEIVKHFGVEATFSKPFDPELLIKKIQTITDEKQNV